MGGDYTTAWKRKMKKFDKKYGKKAEKIVQKKTTTTIPSDRTSSAPSSDSDSEPITTESRKDQKTKHFRIRFSTFDVRLVARAHPTKNHKYLYTTPIYYIMPPLPVPLSLLQIFPLFNSSRSLYKYKGKRGEKGAGRKGKEKGGEGRARRPY
jgi:hypothetical protein